MTAPILKCEFVPLIMLSPQSYTRIYVLSYNVRKIIHEYNYKCDDHYDAFGHRIIAVSDAGDQKSPQSGKSEYLLHYDRACHYVS